MKKQVRVRGGGQVEVTGRLWEKHGKRRMYFSGNGGNACWDLVEKKWIKCHLEFGPIFEMEIAKAFELGG